MGTEFLDPIAILVWLTVGFVGVPTLITLVCGVITFYHWLRGSKSVAERRERARGA